MIGEKFPMWAAFDDMQGKDLHGIWDDLNDLYAHYDAMGKEPPVLILSCKCIVIDEYMVCVPNTGCEPFWVIADNVERKCQNNVIATSPANFT